MASRRDVTLDPFSSSSDPNLSRVGDSLMKKMASGRRSLRFSSKKEKNWKQDALVPVSEGSVEEKKEEEKEVEEEYVLPALPDVPLSGKNRPPRRS